jgi:Flp pilus assembly protein TadG
MIFKCLNTYIRDTHGLATIESAIILPMMFVILLGLYDIGQAIIINQKVTAAAHMAGDLITRKVVVDDNDIDDAWGAAQLVIDPYDRTLLGMDILGIKFDDDDDPDQVWRTTRQMAENPNLPARADGLGVNGEGVIAVSTIYTYTPFFSGPLVGDILMEETSFMRGRKNSLVRYEED